MNKKSKKYLFPIGDDQKDFIANYRDAMAKKKKMKINVAPRLKNFLVISFVEEVRK